MLFERAATSRMLTQSLSIFKKMGELKNNRRNVRRAFGPSVPRVIYESALNRRQSILNRTVSRAFRSIMFPLDHVIVGLGLAPTTSQPIS